MAIGTPQALGTVQGTTTVSTKALTTTANIVAGDLVVVSITWYSSAGAAISSVSDGTNTYTQAFSVNASTGTPCSAALYYCKNASAVGSGASITVTWASNVLAQNISAARVTGISAGTALDKTGTGNTATTTPTASTGVLTSANEIVFGVVSGYNVTSVTPDAAFTSLYDNASSVQLAYSLEYKIVAVTTSVTYGPTLNGSNSTAIGVASFFGVNTYSLTAAQGSFSLTGIAVAIEKTKLLAAAFGSFALTGIAATLTWGNRHLIAAFGSFTFTGQAITIGRGYVMAAVRGLFALTGISATPFKNISLIAARGTFALTGIAQILARQIADASKFARRRVKPSLEKRRTDQPSLDD